MFATTADRELIDLVAELVRVARGFQQEQAFCEGVTFTQFQILDRVVEGGGVLGLAELHAALEVDKSTTTRLVAPLLKRGLVSKRRRTDDRRAFELVASEEGRAVANRVWGCISGAAALVDGFIPADEREAAHRGVRVFARALAQACQSGCCQPVVKGGCCVDERRGGE